MFFFTGEGFADGAMKNITLARARRAGWAAVIVDGAAKIVNGMFCTCVDLYPTSLRAELRGVVNMLRWAIAPLTIWVDNQIVVDGFVKGKGWRCSASRPTAGIGAALQRKMQRRCNSCRR